MFNDIDELAALLIENSSIRASILSTFCAKSSRVVMQQGLPAFNAPTPSTLFCANKYLDDTFVHQVANLNHVQAYTKHHKLQNSIVTLGRFEYFLFDGVADSYQANTPEGRATFEAKVALEVEWQLSLLLGPFSGLASKVGTALLELANRRSIAVDTYHPEVFDRHKRRIQPSMVFTEADNELQESIAIRVMRLIDMHISGQDMAQFTINHRDEYIGSTTQDR